MYDLDLISSDGKHIRRYITFNNYYNITAYNGDQGVKGGFSPDYEGFTDTFTVINNDGDISSDNVQIFSDEIFFNINDDNKYVFNITSDLLQLVYEMLHPNTAVPENKVMIDNVEDGDSSDFIEGYASKGLYRKLRTKDSLVSFNLPVSYTMLGGSTTNNCWIFDSGIESEITTNNIKYIYTCLTPQNKLMNYMEFRIGENTNKPDYLNRIINELHLTIVNLYGTTKCYEYSVVYDGFEWRMTDYNINTVKCSYSILAHDDIFFVAGQFVFNRPFTKWYFKVNGVQYNKYSYPARIPCKLTDFFYMEYEDNPDWIALDVIFEYEDDIYSELIQEPEFRVVIDPINDKIIKYEAVAMVDIYSILQAMKTGEYISSGIHSELTWFTDCWCDNEANNDGYNGRTAPLNLEELERIINSKDEFLNDGLLFYNGHLMVSNAEIGIFNGDDTQLYYPYTKYPTGQIFFHRTKTSNSYGQSWDDIKAEYSE